MGRQHSSWKEWWFSVLPVQIICFYGTWDLINEVTETLQYFWDDVKQWGYTKIFKLIDLLVQQHMTGQTLSISEMTRVTKDMSRMRLEFFPPKENQRHAANQMHVSGK